jgi:ornithine carbamoyltransferase
MRTEGLQTLVDTGLEVLSDPSSYRDALADQILGLYFRGPSTRTRTSFAVAAEKLGGTFIMYKREDLQTSTGEDPLDTSRTLSKYIDGFVIRTNDDVSEMRKMAGQSDLPIINAMSAQEHPTQIVGDLITMKEEFDELDGLHVLYVGEGNNTAASLALAASYIPNVSLTVVAPEGFGIDPQILQKAKKISDRHQGEIVQKRMGDELPETVDAVYATRWQTMGVKREQENWREQFAPYQVTEKLMQQVSIPEHTIFLHDLPAVRGEDVTDEVLDGPQSRAFRQARHKLTAAMAILYHTMASS